MVNAADLGSAVFGRGGSSPSILILLRESKMKKKLELQVGYCDHRTKQNWRELAIAEIWKEYQEDVTVDLNDPNFISLICQNSEEFQKLSNSEKIAAAKGFATALQWLGTSVGYVVLEQIIRAIGKEVKEIPFEEQLTSNKEHVRLSAASLQKKIRRWQEQTK